MSLMPDMDPNSYIEIPGNTQHDFAGALAKLRDARPDLFAPIRYQTSRWERNFTLTPAGGEFIAAAIAKAMED